MGFRAKRRVHRRQNTLPGKFAATGLLLSFMLAGCAADSGEAGLNTEAETPPPAAATKDASSEVAVLAPAKPEKPAPAPPPNLMGMRRAEVVRILGVPVFSRSDRPALLMRYRQDGCILDLFLYPASGPDTDDRPSTQAVEHVEARSVNGGKIASEDCIAAVIEARSSDRKG